MPKTGQLCEGRASGEQMNISTETAIRPQEFLRQPVQMMFVWAVLVDRQYLNSARARASASLLSAIPAARRGKCCHPISLMVHVSSIWWRARSKSSRIDARSATLTPASTLKSTADALTRKHDASVDRHRPFAKAAALVAKYLRRRDLE